MLVKVVSALLDNQRSQGRKGFLPVMHVGRSGQRAIWGDRAPEAEWKGHYGADMHPGPCSVSVGLSADLGEVEAAMKVSGITGQPLTSLKCGGYQCYFSFGFSVKV